MEYTFYIIVRAVIAAYVLYRLYVVVYKKRLFGFWEYLPALREFLLKQSEGSKPELSSSVIGKTNVVLLELV